MATRTPLIAGNWKMYKTADQAAQTAADLVANVPQATVDIMIAPPFTALQAVFAQVKDSRVALGAQNLFWRDEGAYTGEISAGMLTAAGCTHVIIGHSERRQFFGDTDETINLKIEAALAADLIPVFCIGESEAQRDAGDTFNVLDTQIKNGLKGFSVDQLAHLVIAYEPVWAIGTGKTATTDQAQEAHAFIRAQIEKYFTDTLAKSVRILYGGSVKPGNVNELMAMPDVDGALVGGASLDAETFSQIVNYNI